MKTTYKKATRQKRSNKKPLVIGIIVVVVIIACAIGVYAWHHHKQTVTGTPVTQPVTNKGTGKSSTSSTSTTTKGSGTTGDNSSSSSTTGSSSDTTTTSPSVKPNAPFGTFVSNHTPGQNNSPLEEASVCNTSPGVSCNIIFTQGTTTKSLGAKTTDTSGATYWSWTPQNVGLTSGNWTVTAVATSGDQSSSTQDATALEVGQ